jgi:hypothetical protein
LVRIGKKLVDRRGEADRIETPRRDVVLGRSVLAEFVAADSDAAEASRSIAQCIGDRVR